MNEAMLISSVVLLFFIVCILFEALVLTFCKVAPFAKALVYAALVNMASIAVLYFIWPLVSNLGVNEEEVFPLLPILLVITIFTEAALLKLLNRQQLWARLFFVTALMNVVSFAMLYAVLHLM